MNATAVPDAPSTITLDAAQSVSLLSALHASVTYTGPGSATFDQREIPDSVKECDGRLMLPHRVTLTMRDFGGGNSTVGGHFTRELFYSDEAGLFCYLIRDNGAPQAIAVENIDGIKFELHA